MSPSSPAVSSGRTNQTLRRVSQIRRNGPGPVRNRKCSPDDDSCHAPTEPGARTTSGAYHFGLPAHVLRHWESVGLLSPTRVEGGRRRYTRDDLFQVASIVIMKRAGLPLPDIRDFLASVHSSARKDVLRRNHRALQARMAARQSALDLLEAGLNCSHEDIATCPKARSHLAELGDVPDSE